MGVLSLLLPRFRDTLPTVYVVRELCVILRNSSSNYFVDWVLRRVQFRRNLIFLLLRFAEGALMLVSHSASFRCMLPSLCLIRELLHS